jgi:flavin-dependent dehydrogenase
VGAGPAGLTAAIIAAPSMDFEVIAVLSGESPACDKVRNRSSAFYADQSHHCWADHVSREGPLNSFARREVLGDRACLKEINTSDEERRLML